MIMWSAVILRILENGSTRSPGQGSTAGARGWGLGAGAAGTAAAVGARSMTPRMSCLVTRPAKPVPGMVEMSTRCSAAILRTSGVDLRRRRSSAVSTPPSPFGGTGEDGEGRGRTGEVAAGAGAEFDGAVGAAIGGGALGLAAPFSVSITATSVCTGTVWPSWTLISARTPADGAGISASTLSVEISNSGSSRFTSSPSFLSHLLKVPSAIDSPIWGMRTSTRAIESPSIRRKPSCGLHDIVRLGQHEILQGRRIRQRHVVRRHPHDGAVQPREGLLVDARGDLARQATGARVLVYDEHLVGLLHRPHDRGVIHRQQRPEVEDFDRETVVFRQLVGRLERLPHRGPIGDDGQVLPLASQPRLADGSEDLLLLQQRLLDPPVQPFVLEVDDRIVVPDGGLDQALRVPRGGGIDDLQARRVKEGRLRVLRMERTAPHVAATGAAHDHRGRETGAVARGGDVVREHVVGAGDEVDELHLRHRAHAHVGRPGGRADDRRFGDGRVDDACLAELLGKTLRHLERAAVRPYVLPQNEDAGVALHLFPQALAQGFEIGHLDHAVTVTGGSSLGRRFGGGGRCPPWGNWNTTGSRTRQRTTSPLRRAGLKRAVATSPRAAIANSECAAYSIRTERGSALRSCQRRIRPVPHRRSRVSAPSQGKSPDRRPSGQARYRRSRRKRRSFRPPQPLARLPRNQTEE